MSGSDQVFLDFIGRIVCIPCVSVILLIIFHDIVARMSQTLCSNVHCVQMIISFLGVVNLDHFTETILLSRARSAFGVHAPLGTLID